MRRSSLLVAAVTLVAVAASSAGGAAPAFRLASPAFAPGATIPVRYRFTLYALDAPLRLRVGAMRAAFQRARRGHVRGRAQLVGRFGTPA